MALVGTALHRVEHEVLDGDSQRSARRLAATLVLTLVLVCVGVYHETIGTMVSQWISQETFAHGFLIGPICIWLLWRERRTVSTLALAPWWPALAIVALLGFGWLLGELAEVNAARQFAVVLMPAAFVALVAGLPIARQLAFALFYLLFAVPFGEFLVPVMMQQTADFTIAALRMSGIPVWREGLNFVLPSGTWSVVEACSGLRYVIASITVGTLYAWLNFRTGLRRLSMIALAIVVPVIANWIRAYLIVLLGHFSGMKLAAGVDHLIYGWLFFGLVMGLLFAIAGRWRDIDTPAPSSVAPTMPAARMPMTSVTPRALLAAAGCAFAMVLVWPLVAQTLRSIASDAPVPTKLPARVTRALIPIDGRPAFEPAYRGGQVLADGLYRIGAGEPAVSLSVRGYADARRDGEMIGNAQAVAVPGDARVRIVSVAPASRAATAQWVLRVDGELYLAWHWYTIAGQQTDSDIVGKLLGAYALLSARAGVSTTTTIATRIDAYGEKPAMQRLAAMARIVGDPTPDRGPD